MADKVSNEEMAGALQGPAFNSNKFFTTNLANGLRIAFCEALPGIQPVYRSGVILAYQDAVALRDLLSEVLKDIEPHIAAEEQARHSKAN